MRVTPWGARPGGRATPGRGAGVKEKHRKKQGSACSCSLASLAPQILLSDRLTNARPRPRPRSRPRRRDRPGARPLPRARAPLSRRLSHTMAQPAGATPSAGLGPAPEPAAPPAPDRPPPNDEFMRNFGVGRLYTVCVFVCVCVKEREGECQARRVKERGPHRSTLSRSNLSFVFTGPPRRDRQLRRLPRDGRLPVHGRRRSQRDVVRRVGMRRE